MSINAVESSLDVFCDESAQNQEEGWIKHEIETTRKISLPEMRRTSTMFSQKAAVFSANRLSSVSFGYGREKNLYTSKKASSIGICYVGNHAEVSASTDSDGSAKVEASVSHTEATDRGGSFSVEGSVKVERDSDGNTKASAGGSLGWDF